MKTATLLALRVPDFEAAIRKTHSAALRTRPVAIVTSFRPLGRILAACPTARAEGIAVEMHYAAARERCPGVRFFLPDPHLSGQALHRLLKEARKYTPLVEAAEGGRVLLDTRGTERLWGGGGTVANRLREDVRRSLELPAAAGLSVCRPWSLLASRAAGDEGLCVVEPGGEDEFFDRVPAVWVDGLTPASRARLLELNIRSLGQLRRLSYEEIMLQFGKSCGQALWRVLRPEPWDAAALGVTVVRAGPSREVRTEAVLTEATIELEKVRLAVRCLASRIACDLRGRDMGTGGLRFTLLYADGVAKTVQVTCGGFLQDEGALTHLARELLEKAFKRRVKVSRLWLVAEKLAVPERQGVLFPERGAGDASGAVAPGRSQTQLYRALDCIRKRYGEDALGVATLLPGA